VTETTPQSRRDRLRSRRSTAFALKLTVFLAGLLFILVGLALSALPGPLTIPPVLLGLWIWSTEFERAQRLLDAFMVKARQAWDDAKEHPVRAGFITAVGVAGLVVFVVLGGPGWVKGHVLGLF
jgi:hypothetical protein